MQYGLSLPNGGPWGDARSLANLAQLAEDSGWNGVFLEDYIVWQSRQDVPTYDPWVVLAATAMQTKHLRLGTHVTPLARRRPWKLAREAVTIDHLSNGRLILGVGLGDTGESVGADISFTHFNEMKDAKERSSMLDEALNVLAGLWSGEPFRYDGQYYQVQEVTFLPPPIQSPRIPIWIGGGLPLSGPMQRAARWDGMCPYKHKSHSLMPDDIRTLRDFVLRQRGSLQGYDIAVGGVQDAQIGRQSANGFGLLPKQASPGGQNTFPQILVTLKLCKVLSKEDRCSLNNINGFELHRGESMKREPAYPTLEHQKAAEAITEYFVSNYKIDAVLLVNSCARGKATRDSCLDIVVLARPDEGRSPLKDLEAGWEQFEKSSEVIQRLYKTGKYSVVHPDFVNGIFLPREQDESAGPDDFEVEVGNFMAYSVPLWQGSNYFAQLQGQWLPYYSEELRQKRLERVRWYCLNNLHHIPLYIERGLYFQSFDRLYNAYREFLQALFIARRTYPIAYNKWIHEQIVEILGLPELYEQLIHLFEIRQFESHEIADKAKELEQLLEQYAPSFSVK